MTKLPEYLTALIPMIVAFIDSAPHCKPVGLQQGKTQ